MSQISKCPKALVILSYWEASGEVSKLRCKSLLYSSSKRSYCSTTWSHEGAPFWKAISHTNLQATALWTLANLYVRVSRAMSHMISNRDPLYLKCLIDCVDYSQFFQDFSWLKRTQDCILWSGRPSQEISDWSSRQAWLPRWLRKTLRKNQFTYLCIWDFSHIGNLPRTLGTPCWGENYHFSQVFFCSNIKWPKPETQLPLNYQIHQIWTPHCCKACYDT